MRLFTVGHSNHSLERFQQFLAEAGITAIVDVRTAPASRYNPHFNKDNLERALPEAGVAYFFAGKYLGGRPADPTCYKSRQLPGEEVDFLHEVDYAEVMKRPWFVRGIQRLLEIAAEQPTAILCSEEDPNRCHRHHLIARYLLVQHPEVEVRHLRGDGQTISAASLHTSVDEAGGEQLSFLGGPGEGA